MDKTSAFFDQDLNDLRKSLIEHPLYNSMENLNDIKKFMEVHVYAVWDFMSLVKNLQMNLTCVSTPWIPSENSLTARLINEIVWGEETDIDKNQVAKSHFEMYLDSMNEIGANTNKIKHLVRLVKQGRDIFKIIESLDISNEIKDFLNFTFSVIKDNKVHVTAAVFTFGREDLIPNMFIEIVRKIKLENNSVESLIYYLERHIEMDGDHHGPMAMNMIKNLCENNDDKIFEALDSSKLALRLKYPVSVECSVSSFFSKMWEVRHQSMGCPASSYVTINFDPTDINKTPIKLEWYDGGLRPSYPSLIPTDTYLGGEKKYKWSYDDRGRWHNYYGRLR